MNIQFEARVWFGHVVASPPPCRYLPPTDLYELTSATTPDRPAEGSQPSPEENLKGPSLSPGELHGLGSQRSRFNLFFTPPTPLWSRVYSSASADDLLVGQVPFFHQLYVFCGSLLAAGFCEDYSTRQENMMRQDLRSRVVPGRVGVAVPVTFCFCGVFVF
ncbi:hypothetical protein E2C01_030064 [Portunus trituberculatus]|uniref:Uncharacterized protein n=1 Tax=Portunus trituberculatus TaxID=210409 RepID=A0A5B7EPY7_PORTR|nr:hypothetical protein [Portunus trituberculatus]